MFYAGFARVDVTPPLGSPMAGYFSYRYADGILDPIELNAIAIGDGEDTICVVTADILMATEVYSTKLREMIANKTGLDAEHVFIQGLHQHTSVFLGAAPNAPASPNKFYDKTYLDVLERKFCDVCQMALDDRKEARVSIAEKETAEPISFIRRYRMKDGSSSTNPGRLNPNIDHPIGQADNTVRLVKFVRENAKDIAMVAFQTHPDVIGGKKFSADWPGFVRRMTEKDLEDVHCILINGCQGDTNHIDTSKPDIATRGEPDYMEKRYAYSRFMGRTITDVVLQIWNQTQPIGDGKVTGQVRMEYIPTNTTYIDRVAEFKEKKKLMYAGLLKLKLDEKGEVNRVSALLDETIFRRVPVSVVGFGKVVIAGFGGEPFTQYATETRESAPDLFVLTACCANGGQGYLPTKQAFLEGGYEARSSRFTLPVAEVLPRSAIEMIRIHKDKQ